MKMLAGRVCVCVYMKLIHNLPVIGWLTPSGVDRGATGGTNRPSRQAPGGGAYGGDKATSSRRQAVPELGGRPPDEV